MVRISDISLIYFPESSVDVIVAIIVIHPHVCFSYRIVVSLAHLAIVVVSTVVIQQLTYKSYSSSFFFLAAQSPGHFLQNVVKSSVIFPFAHMFMTYLSYLVVERMELQTRRLLSQ